MGYYLCTYITFVSTVLGVGFSVGAIKNGENESRANALYLFARSFALMCIAIIPICMVSPKLLFVITAAMLIVQIADGFIGIILKNKMRTFGPFFMAIFHAVCLLSYL